MSEENKVYNVDKMALLPDVPKFGLGTAFTIGKEHELDKEGRECITESSFKSLLDRALDLGCRHFDCAPLYGTQRLVGECLRGAMKNLGLSRSELFVTSKLPVNMMRGDNIDKSLKSSLKELDLAYLDLFLVHAPFATKYLSESEIYPLDAEGNLLLDEQDERLLESAWQRLVDLKRKGYVRYIGLSNVNTRQLERMAKIHPVDVVQGEYHLYHQDRELFDHCEELDIHFEAYAAFGCPPRARRQDKAVCLEDPLVLKLARENQLSPAQVIIQWLHKQPLSYVIRCDNIAQLEENFASSASKTTLSMNELIDLDSVNKRQRLYLYDHFKGIARHREYPFKRPASGQSQVLVAGNNKILDAKENTNEP